MGKVKALILIRIIEKLIGNSKRSIEGAKKALNYGDLEMVKKLIEISKRLLKAVDRALERLKAMIEEHESSLIVGKKA